MKKRLFPNYSIKFFLTVCLFSFVILTIFILMVFQIYLVDSFHQNIRIHDTKNMTYNFAKHIDLDELEDLINLGAGKNGIMVSIYKENAKPLLQSDNYHAYSFAPHQIDIFFQKLKQNGGEHLFILSRDEWYQLFSEDSFEQDAVFDKYFAQYKRTLLIDQKNKNQSSTILFAKLAPSEKYGEVLILSRAYVSSISSINHTIQVQLTVIFFILLIVSLLFIFFMYRHIALPINKITKSAVAIQKGDYSVVFDGKGYREINELNQTLNHSVRELSKIERYRKELLANISHDMRTPLTLITGYSEIMRDLPNENTPENLQIIIDETRRLTNLVNDALDYSKLSAKTVELQYSYFCLTDIVQKLVERFSALTKQEHYRFIFKAKKKVWVAADEVKITQVIYNLINNAISYCGEDRLVFITQKVTPKNEVVLEVTDHGPGIPEEDLPHIWDRYFKIDKTHQRTQLGSGLGLSIVKKTLELHDAEYGVTSSLNKGSTFWFSLPVADPNQPLPKFSDPTIS